MTEPVDGSYVNPSGECNRDANYIASRITADGRDGFPVEPGRYRLVVSRACPWANRAIIVRRLLGLEPVLSMGVAGPTHDARSSTFDLDPPRSGCTDGSIGPYVQPDQAAAGAAWRGHGVTYGWVDRDRPGPR